MLVMQLALASPNYSLGSKWAWTLAEVRCVDSPTWCNGYKHNVQYGTVSTTFLNSVLTVSRMKLDETVTFAWVTAADFPCTSIHSWSCWCVTRQCHPISFTFTATPLKIVLHSTAVRMHTWLPAQCSATFSFLIDFLKYDRIGNGTVLSLVQRNPVLILIYCSSLLTKIRFSSYLIKICVHKNVLRQRSSVSSRCHMFKEWKSRSILLSVLEILY